MGEKGVRRKEKKWDLLIVFLSFWNIFYKKISDHMVHFFGACVSSNRARDGKWTEGTICILPQNKFMDIRYSKNKVRTTLYPHSRMKWCLKTTCILHIHVNSIFNYISNKALAYIWKFFQLHSQAYFNNILKHTFDENHIIKNVQSNAT